MNQSEQKLVIVLRKCTIKVVHIEKKSSTRLVIFRLLSLWNRTPMPRFQNKVKLCYYQKLHWSLTEEENQTRRQKEVSTSVSPTIGNRNSYLQESASIHTSGKAEILSSMAMNHQSRITESLRQYSIGRIKSFQKWSKATALI